MTPLSIAAAQVLSLRGDVDRNIASHLELAELAAGPGAGLVVFPELSLTSYALDLASELAFTQYDSRLAPLREAAKRRQAILAVGAPVRLTGELQIASLLLLPDGRSDVYTKHHLHSREHDYFVPGTRNPRIDLQGNQVAFAICADTSHDAHREAASGASMYVAGVCFDPEGFPENLARMRGHARKHGMITLLSNSAGPAAGFESAGNSSIATREADGWRGKTMRV